MKLPLRASIFLESNAGLAVACTFFLFRFDTVPVTELSRRVCRPKMAIAKFLVNCGNVFEMIHTVSY